MASSTMTEQDPMTLIRQLTTAVDSIESEMPHGEPGWWLAIDRANAADNLGKVEPGRARWGK